MVGDPTSSALRLNDEPARGCANNKVVTAEYTPLNFIPKNLFKQFHRAANCYFLFVGALQLEPSISNSGGLPTVWAPLVCVLLVTALKDFIEDLSKHKSDNEENGRQTLRIEMSGDTAQETSIRSADVRVGDIIMIKNRELIPADMLVLASSEGQSCSVMTANLDGETNLKVKEVHNDFVRANGRIVSTGLVECDLPNEHLESFTGTLQLTDKKVSLSTRNVLLRGCMLRQTEWVKGVVIYGGPDTKIQMNLSNPPPKLSALMKYSNVQTKYGVIVMMAFCLVGGICGAVGGASESITDAWYLGSGSDVSATWQLTSKSAPSNVAFVAWLKFWSFFLMFANFVPITLFVTLDFVKVFQKVWMQWDLNMYHEIACPDGSMSQFPMKVNTSDLNEELGMVEQIFSDKTGTLTCNVMDYRKCSINGVSYGLGSTEIGKGYALRMGLPIPKEPVKDLDGPQTDHVNFTDPSFDAAMQEKGSEQYAAVCDFYLHLALNHEVQPEVHGGNVVYSAANPDEAALVYAAKHFGFAFQRNELGKIALTVLGETRTYELLHNLEFSSDRKRSSVIIRKPDGSITLFCKGADNVIKKRMSQSKNSDTVLTQTYGHLEEFVNDGLRTLLVANSDLEPAAYDEWAAKYALASTAMEQRDEKMAALMDEIEHDLVLQGSTAIEDKLQDGVGDCLSSLRDAGILVWMLTGDKVDTAINIGFSCSLLTMDMKLLRLVADDGQMNVDAAKVPLEPDLDRVLQKLIGEVEVSSEANALVVDTGALTAIIRFGKESEMLQICKACKSVICARVSPKQKAQVVGMVRKARPGMVTLAIGDGANDVPMIQTANVGVGIFGLEGKQAVMCADHALGQFRFLKTLLLVHGRWHYRRIATVITYVWYKACVQVLPQFWFGFFSVFSATRIYFDPMYQVYNVLYTSTAIVAMAILDQDLSAVTALKMPQLYFDGPSGAFHSTKIFWTWMIEAIVHSLFITFAPMAAAGGGVYALSDGQTGGLFDFGNIVYFLVVLTVTARLGFDLRMINVWTGTFLVISVFFWICSWIYFDTYVSASWPELYGNFSNHSGCVIFWLIVLCSSVLTAITSLTRESIATCLNPTSSIIAREMEKGGDEARVSPD